jgi:hypothetical protein
MNKNLLSLSKLLRIDIPLNKRYRLLLYHSHFNIENPNKSAIFETSKHLNGLDTVYVRNIM